MSSTAEAEDVLDSLKSFTIPKRKKLKTGTIAESEANLTLICCAHAVPAL